MAKLLWVYVFITSRIYLAYGHLQHKQRPAPSMSTTTKQKTEDSCCCWISIMLWWAALYQVCYKLRWTTILWWQFQVSKKPYDPCMKYLYANFVFLERAIIILIKWKINKQKKVNSYSISFLIKVRHMSKFVTFKGFLSASKSKSYFLIHRLRGNLSF